MREPFVEGIAELQAEVASQHASDKTLRSSSLSGAEICGQKGTRPSRSWRLWVALTRVAKLAVEGSRLKDELAGRDS